MAGVKECPDLAQVKAVLRNLQRLDLPQPEGLDSRPIEWNLAGTGNPPASSDKVRDGISVFDRKRAAISGTKSAASPRKRGVAAFSVAGAIAAATILFFVYRPAGVPSKLDRVPAAMGPVLPAEVKQTSAANGSAATMQPQENLASVLSEARRLLNEGDVALARTRLLRGSPAERADFALLLAQSYDPIYLRTLPAANALPDKAEAMRWYRTWYEIAARNGLEMDNARFQRIIKHLQ